MSWRSRHPQMPSRSHLRMRTPRPNSKYTHPKHLDMFEKTYRSFSKTSLCFSKAQPRRHPTSPVSGPRMAWRRDWSNPQNKKRPRPGDGVWVVLGICIVWVWGSLTQQSAPFRSDGPSTRGNAAPYSSKKPPAPPRSVPVAGRFGASGWFCP